MLSRTHLTFKVVLLALLLCSSTSLNAKEVQASFTSHVGVIEGAPYRIDVPIKWNGDLVMYLHGYEPKGMPRASEMLPNDFDRWIVSQGFVLAQSQFATQGWAVAEALTNNEQLRQKTIEMIGKPRRTLLIGQSLGGHLVLSTLESNPESYSGAIALCGANASATDVFRDGVVGALTVFDYYYPNVLPLAAGGLADTNSVAMFDPVLIETALQGNETVAAILAVQFEIPRPELAVGLLTRYVVLREMMERAGGFPVDNTQVRYSGFDDDLALNAGVRRYTGNPSAIAYTQRYSSLLGTAPKPVVILSNRVDSTVPGKISNQYAVLANSSGNAENILTLPSIGEGHCAFTPKDVESAFSTLSSWLDTGTRREFSK